MLDILKKLFAWDKMNIKFKYDYPRWQWHLGHFAIASTVSYALMNIFASVPFLSGYENFRIFVAGFLGITVLSSILEYRDFKKKGKLTMDNLGDFITYNAAWIFPIWVLSGLIPAAVYALIFVLLYRITLKYMTP